jgi:hypothetical protein
MIWDEVNAKIKSLDYSGFGMEKHGHKCVKCVFWTSNECPCDSRFADACCLHWTGKISALECTED